MSLYTFLKTTETPTELAEKTKNIITCLLKPDHHLITASTGYVLPWYPPEHTVDMFGNPFPWYPQEPESEYCIDDCSDVEGMCAEVLDIETEDAEFLAENVMPAELMRWSESSR